MKAEDLLPDHQSTVQFPDGMVVRKGTVAAFLANAKIWCDTDADPRERAQAERDLLDALPALHALGLFEVLSIHDEALREFVATH